MVVLDANGSEPQSGSFAFKVRTVIRNLERRLLLGALRIKLTNMLSIFADSLGQASNFQSIVINGCSPAANLIFPACLEKCLVSKKFSLHISCEEF